MSSPASPPAPQSGLRFALLAHPSVQGVRSLTKLLLPWLFTTEQFGEASLAGLIVFGVQHVAAFGLDEALVGAREVTGGTWRAMRRLHLRLGLALVALTALAGVVLAAWPAQRGLGALIAGLAPALFVANMATLPTWLLVRERRFRAAYLTDVGSVAAFAAATVVAAELGAGAWSLLAGWHAQALAALVISTRASRALVPRETGGAEEWPALRRTGGALCGAALLNYAGERADGATVGFALGRAALGLYETAQNLAGVMVGYTQSLSERLLFPTLAAHGRARGLGGAYLEALRTVLVFLLPAHVALALAAGPLVAWLFPERWHAAGGLAALLALAAGARCFDLVALTALKAAGRGRTVLRLGLARVGALALALALTLPHGLAWVPLGVLCARALSAALALALASTRLELAAHRAGAGMARAGGALLAFAVLAVPAGLWLAAREAPAMERALELGALCAAGWLVARTSFDRARLRAELKGLAARVGQAVRA